MSGVVKVENKDFEHVLGLIKQAQYKAASAVNSVVIDLYWQIGKYVSEKIAADGWGNSTVDSLSEYILSQEPGARGYSSQNIRRMKYFYETYKDQPEVADLLRANTWSNNLHIINKTKTPEERRFYLELAVKEQYSARELERQLDSCYYERLKLSDGNAPSGLPARIKDAGIIRDNYMLEFLNLSESYLERDLQKAILDNLKQFILEFGCDFIFMGEEYHVQVGNHDFYIDLLFYHRGLQCLVAFELKIDEFKPEYLGKMNFYLEALDRDMKKPNENPSVGIILCKDKDNKVVEYAMNKDLSATLVAKYETELIDKNVLQAKLDELYALAEEDVEDE